MLFNQYTISIATANNTIERMLRILSEREVTLKRRDVKEVITQLLSFDSASAFNKTVRRYQEHGTFPYGLGGVHLDYPNVRFQRFQTAIDARNYFSKNNGYDCFCCFDINHVSAGGFEYKTGDFILSTSPIEVAKVLLDWEEEAFYLEYILRDEKDRSHKLNEGYWRFEAIGAELLMAIGKPAFEMDICNEDLNSLEVDQAELEEYCLNELLETVLPFSCLSADECEDYVLDWLVEEHDQARDKVRNVKMYKAFVKRFMPYFPIQVMAMKEAYGGPLEYLKVYRDFGIAFDDHHIMINAAAGSNDEVLAFLLEEGGDVEGFYRVDLSDSPTCSMHDQVATFVQGRDDLDVGVYLNTLKDLGVDINYRDTYNGTRLLHIIAYLGNRELYNYCVELGCDDSALNNENVSPADLINMPFQERQKRRPYDSRSVEAMH